MTAASSSELLGRLFGSTEASVLFNDRARLQGMLDFEAALSRAEAAVGVIPAKAVPAIVAKCRAELFDIDELARKAAQAGNPAIPLVSVLTRLVATSDPDAARYVHWGATSQDVMDTGLVLQLRAFLTLLEAGLDRLAAGLARCAGEHKTTPLVGRTWLQHALPITMGLKAAGWLDATQRHRDRVAAIHSRTLVLQFGGAVGTLAALGDRGLPVAEALARELGLALPALPWHAHRDRLVEVGTALGLLVGTLGKIARDIALLMQTDVAEAFEPSGEGRGGSSTMPQKHNPVAAAIVLSAATRVPGLVAALLSGMIQEHERGLGGWHAEWETLPEICVLVAGSLGKTAETVEGLTVDPARMRANLETTRGQIMAEAATMALGEQMGRLEAHELVQRACREAAASGKDLREVLAQDAAVRRSLTPGDLDRLFRPENYLGSAVLFVDRVLEASIRPKASGPSAPSANVRQ